MARWLSRCCNTRSHPEHGRETHLRPWYCVLRRGRVGRRRATIQDHKNTSPNAGWSSPVARQAHNLKVTGSNPVPASTNAEHRPTSPLATASGLFACPNAGKPSAPPARSSAVRWPISSMRGSPPAISGTLTDRRCGAALRPAWAPTSAHSAASIAAAPRRGNPLARWGTWQRLLALGDGRVGGVCEHAIHAVAEHRRVQVGIGVGKGINM